MTISSRFAVAVHILTLLETGRGEPLTSEYMAGSVNTNPSVVRRILTLLARAGLTRARMGAGGGTVLARPAGEITLRDVYRAVECEERLFSLHHELWLLKVHHEFFRDRVSSWEEYERYRARAATRYPTRFHENRSSGCVG